MCSNAERTIMREFAKATESSVIVIPSDTSISRSAYNKGNWHCTGHVNTGTNWMYRSHQNAYNIGRTIDYCYQHM